MRAKTTCCDNYMDRGLGVGMIVTTATQTPLSDSRASMA